MSILKTIGKISSIGLELLGSIWNATIHIVWGIATVFLLAGLITYYNIDATAIASLLDIANIIIQNWVAFWWVFFALEIFPKINEIRKGDN